MQSRKSQSSLSPRSVLDVKFDSDSEVRDLTEDPNKLWNWLRFVWEDSLSGVGKKEAEPEPEIYPVVDGSMSTQSDMREGKGEKGGLAALMNLGNTCYMNSIIQCLVHTPPIVDIFLHNYNSDINADNLLGKNDELASAFGALLRKMWSSGQKVVAPRAFKEKFVEFAPQFDGDGQQDSQEMLSSLLDGLHKNLNKLQQETYIKAKYSEGLLIDVAAVEAWKNYKDQNDSVIVDAFHGLSSSTMICQDCGKTSFTFHPFKSLLLPLVGFRSITVTVFDGNGSKLPLPYTVTVAKDGVCNDLTKAVSDACLLNSQERLELAQVYEYKSYFVNPLDLLSTIEDTDYLVAYRFNLVNKGRELFKLEVYHGEEDTFDTKLYLFGTPLVTYMKKETIRGIDIAACVKNLLSPLRRDHDDCELPSYSLLLADIRASSFEPLESYSLVTPSDVTKVLLKWNQKQHAIYDVTYLNRIPKVHTSRQGEVSLLSCLEAFLAEEPMEGDNMWGCPSCNEKRPAKKKLDLWRLPNILVFHLNRFEYSRGVNRKITTLVNFPIHNVDLSHLVKPCDGQTYVYDLFAINCHDGSVANGHYTTYAKVTDSKSWYIFDDYCVSEVDEAEIKTSAPYLLFYQRVK